MADVVVFNGDTAAKSIQSDFFTEFLDGNTFAPWMGGTSDVINVETVGKGQGDTYAFTLVGALNPDQRATGSQQAEGNGEGQKVFSNVVQLQLVRKPAKLENVLTIAQRTPLMLWERLRPQLMETAQEMLKNDIIDSALYPTGGNSPAQHRALFGAGESNYNAVLNTALATVDNVNDKLTVSHIRRLKRKAVSQRDPSFNRVRRIRPMKVETDNGAKDEFYVLFADSRAVADLKEDSVFVSISLRGVMEDRAPSLVRGSRLVGMVDNVIIWEEPALDRIGYLTAGTSSTPVAHNLFCGAQAFGVVFGYIRGKLDDKYEDYGNIYEACYTDIRAQGILKFNGYENGIIHSFTTAANA